MFSLASMSLIYKAFGYGVIVSGICKVLEHMKKPTLASAVHIIAWCTLGYFCLQLLFNALKDMPNVWRF